MVDSYSTFFGLVWIREIEGLFDGLSFRNRTKPSLPRWLKPTDGLVVIAALKALRHPKAEIAETAPESQQQIPHCVRNANFFREPLSGNELLKTLLD